MPVSLRNLKFTECVYCLVYDSDGKCNISLMQLGTKKWIYQIKFCLSYLIFTLVFLLPGVDETAGMIQSS